MFPGHRSGARRSQPSHLRPRRPAPRPPARWRRRLPVRRPSAAARRSLSLSGATPTIRFPWVRPSRIIEIVETMFRTSFWAVPAFSRVDPAITSAPTGTHTSQVGDAGKLRALDAGDARRQRTRRARGLERSDDPGRAAARADADDDVRRGGAERLDRLRAAGPVVLGLVARCDESRDGHRERRLALDGVERREAPGCARARIDQPPAGSEPRRDLVDEGGDRRRRPGHGRGHGRVPGVHELDQLERRAQVEIGSRRVPRFRAELVEGGHGRAVYADNRRLVNTILVNSWRQVRSQRQDCRDVVLTTAADRVRCTSP